MDDIEAGSLRQTASIEEDTSDEGAGAQRWDRVAHRGVPCRVREQSGQRAERHDQLEARRAVMVHMRWIDGLTTARHRLRVATPCGDRVLSIDRIQDAGDGTRRWMVLHCLEVTA